MNHRPRVIGVASGKGGVGKTTVSINLAVAMAQAGHRVMLFDSDTGLANAQIALGQRVVHHIGHVLSGEKTLSEIVAKTPHGILLVPGGSGVREISSLSTLTSGGLVQAFSEFADQIDVLIVDAAAGLSDQVITFMRAVDYRLIVIRDEPSSIADAYGIIKVLSQEGVTEKIVLLPNMMEDDAAGATLHARLNDVTKRFLNLSLSYVGCIRSDELVLDALRKQTSVLEHAPGSAASRDFRVLAEAVTNLPRPALRSAEFSFFNDRKTANA
ncbi:MAG: MinD/ParA family protein [Betaproteobacteria bacterium]|nr:MinD/ParA family protein [Betaproteobacteria bacterium]NBT75912.1 MinD/ParA family protein [Betaproteobacteria bacterium]NBY14477.1 MinD/ParA family protein [Betaproteobacteria bacterium]NCA16417.1 MinD/ParA family protein [Betaproteobacteria bacterium]NDF03864.1 MinD/ParA family protein [Betaproteobacteria bacterium]